MTNDVVILLADDDPGHARLIEKNLIRTGLRNKILRFQDGQQILDYIFRRGSQPPSISHAAFLIFLDIRMPKVNGVEVLRQIKADPELRKIPVSMLTTTDDPQEVERCYALGCNNYIVKPVDYELFSNTIQQIGLFVSTLQIPRPHSWQT